MLEEGMRSTTAPALSVSDNIARLVPYKPGKPIEEVKRELGLTEVVKLASNENNLGPSPRAMEAMQKAIWRVHLYPDGACHELREALSAHLGIPGDYLIFGNGSDEIIHFLGLTFLTPGDELIQADPSFVRYEAAGILNNAICHLVPLRDWTHDLEAMAAYINQRTRLIFIANPNNPTGTIVTEEAVHHFMQRVPERVIVVFDEAYFEYVERQDYPNTLRYVQEGYNVMVLRTFSKAYGLAGLRIGYGIARPDIIAYLNQVREPFNVSLIAQEAAKAALGDTEHIARSRAMNVAGKRQLYAAFDAMGLAYAPSEANFVWVDVGRNANQVFRQLLRRGIIVRAFEAPGTENCLRVTIGTAEENAKFLHGLREVLSQ
jgi:histidinol-phosphate aminotransferase